MEEFIAFIEGYGYLAVFVGSVLEGETVVLIGGLLSHELYLRFPVVVLCAFFGALVSDWGFFFLGRRRPAFFKKRLACLAKFAKTPTAFIENNPRTASFLMRYMYGFRHVVPYSIGASCIPTKLFLIWNSAGAFAWALTMTTGGYLAGNLLASLMVSVRDHETRVIIIILSMVTFYVLMMRIGTFIIERERRVKGPVSHHSEGDCERKESYTYK